MFSRKLSVAYLSMTVLCVATTASAEDASALFPGCTLGDVTGAGMSMRTYACGKERDDAHLEVDAALPGFIETSKSSTGNVKIVRVRSFRKEATASIAAVLPAVRKASPGAFSKACTFTPLDVDGVKSFVLSPTGRAKARWTAAQKSGQEMQPPCGALGVQMEGDLYFRELPGDPSTVVFINAGSELQIFDPKTLKADKSK